MRNTVLIFIATWLCGGNLHAQCDGQLDSLLVGYYPFTVDASDSAGAANDGSIAGGAFLASSPMNGGIHFDGVNDYVILDDNFDLGDDYTVSLWVKPNSYEVQDLFSMRNQCTISPRGWNQALIGLSGTAGNTNAEPPYYVNSASFTVDNQVVIALGHAHANCGGWSNAFVYTVPGVTVDTSCWNHIAVSCENNSNHQTRTYKVYINSDEYDAVLSNQPSSNSVNSATNPFDPILVDYKTYFGINHNNFNQPNHLHPYDGKMDDIYVYERALDSCEAIALHNRGFDPLDEILRHREFNCSGGLDTFYTVSGAPISIISWIINGTFVGGSDTVIFDTSNDSICEVQLSYQRPAFCTIDTLTTTFTVSGTFTEPPDTLIKCPWDSVWINETWVIEPGVYLTLSGDSCDTVITTVLMNDSGTVDTIVVEACDSLVLLGNTFFESTWVTERFPNQNGCDSMLIYDVKIAKSSLDTVEISGCSQINVMDTTLFENDTLFVSYLSVQGCDSDLVYFVMVSEPGIDTFNFAGSGEVTVMDTTLFVSDSFYVSFQTLDSCDSLIWVQVSLVSPDSEPFVDTALIDCFRFFPNVITPNGDGLNDAFVDGGNCQKNVDQFYVYNRWGKLIHFSSQTRPHWDGQINNSTATEGIYYYLIEDNGERYRGSFSLLEK
ncbi:MAG: gliding motility-associated C-terminal domain-containing protein [Flavobacteriales bacterium]|nr:gliding motility-associated C-terminal domain-containing protein [Flavobacteriales bacterium]